MRRYSALMVGSVAALVFFGMVFCLHGAKAKGEMLEYEVLSIDARTWVVTAKETASGDVVKFRMKPAVFKGFTFDAEIGGLSPGQSFSVRGPRNARLGGLTMVNPPPGPPPQGRGKRGASSGGPLTWEIMNVHPRQWVVTAKNRQTRQVIKFKVEPQCFTGFRFLADLRDIKRGQGFSLVAPNDQPFTNCTTLLQ